MLAVDWVSVGWGTVGSALVGIVLWLVLPRGAVLTKTRVYRNQWDDEPLYDMWEIKNDSAVSIVLTSVEHLGPHSYRRWSKMTPGQKLAAPFRHRARFGKRGNHAGVRTRLVNRWRSRKERRANPGRFERSGFVPTQLDADSTPPPHSVSLNFADDTLEIRRTDVEATTWPGTVVPPGETMRAHVLGINSLLIRYRRAGFWGQLERRQLEVHGLG
jgi:hypothetical protein